MQNFVKITKLILLCPKYPNLGIWATNFWKNNVRCQISIFKIGRRQNLVKRLESWYFFVQNTQIWAFGPKVWKTKVNRKFQISPIWTFSVSSGCFSFFLGRLGWFRIVLAGFGSFGLAPGISKYEWTLVQARVFQAKLPSHCVFQSQTVWLWNLQTFSAWNAENI